MMTTLLGGLVAFLSGAMVVDKFMHTFGLHKLLSAQLRNAADEAVKKALATPDANDDRIAAAGSAVAHAIADAIDRGDDQKALSLGKEFAEKRTAK